MDDFCHTLSSTVPWWYCNQSEDAVCKEHGKIIISHSGDFTEVNKGADTQADVHVPWRVFTGANGRNDLPSSADEWPHSTWYMLYTMECYWACRRNSDTCHSTGEPGEPSVWSEPYAKNKYYTFYLCKVERMGRYKAALEGCDDCPKMSTCSMPLLNCTFKKSKIYYIFYHNKKNQRKLPLNGEMIMTQGSFVQANKIWKKQKQNTQKPVSLIPLYIHNQRKTVWVSPHSHFSWCLSLK